MGLFTKRKKPKEEKQEGDPKKTAKEREWSDVHEDRKYVVQGGKVQCPFCTTPVAEIIVTSNTISLQGKYYTTTADCDGKINFDFQGQCTAAPGISKPPCKSVIQLGEWKDFSETFINDDNAILVQSTIPCNFGGIDIKVIESGQIEVLTEIEPRVIKNPRITRLYWIDAETEEKVKRISYGTKVKLVMITKDYNEKEIANVTVKWEDTNDFINGKKELKFSGIVDSEGIAVSEQVFDNNWTEG